MYDDKDTIVDPHIRREVLKPRPDHKRALVLVAVIALTAMVTAGVTVFFVVRAPNPAPAARATIPPDDVAPPAPPAEVVPPADVAPPVEPVAPVEVVAPVEPDHHPCVGYRQKHMGSDEAPARTDCL